MNCHEEARASVPNRSTSSRKSRTRQGRRWDLMTVLSVPYYRRIFRTGPLVPTVEAREVTRIP